MTEPPFKKSKVHQSMLLNLDSTLWPNISCYLTICDGVACKLTSRSFLLLPNFSLCLYTALVKSRIGFLYKTSFPGLVFKNDFNFNYVDLSQHGITLNHAMDGILLWKNSCGIFSDDDSENWNCVCSLHFEEELTSDSLKKPDRYVSKVLRLPPYSKFLLTCKQNDLEWQVEFSKVLTHILEELATIKLLIGFAPGIFKNIDQKKWQDERLLVEINNNLEFARLYQELYGSSTKFT